MGSDISFFKSTKDFMVLSMSRLLLSSSIWEDIGGHRSTLSTSYPFGRSSSVRVQGNQPSQTKTGSIMLSLSQVCWDPGYHMEGRRQQWPSLQDKFLHVLLSGKGQY